MSEGVEFFDGEVEVMDKLKYIFVVLRRDTMRSALEREFCRCFLMESERQK